MKDFKFIKLDHNLKKEERKFQLNTQIAWQNFQLNQLKWRDRSLFFPRKSYSNYGTG